MSPAIMRAGRTIGGMERPGTAAIMTVLPYVYLALMAAIILVVEPALIDGPGAFDVRAQAVLPLALLGFGQTLVIFTRGLDLSIGGVVSLISAILATTGSKTGASLTIELIALVALGALIGVTNGALIAYGGMQPFIATLAMWSILDGIALLILPVEGGAVSSGLTSAVAGNIAGVPKSVWGVILLFALWVWIRRTRFIRNLLALGGDEARARLLAVLITVVTVSALTLSARRGPRL